MKRKYTAKLTNESVIKFSKPRGGSLSVKLVDLLQDLHKHFPHGFQPHGATEFIKANYGELEPFFRYGLLSNAGFYTGLVKSGFLRRTPRTVAASIPPYKTRTEYYYTFNEDLASCDASVNVTIPEGLHNLIEAGRNLVGQDFVPDAVKVLETMILENKPFLRVMEAVKQENPTHYTRLGGDYLDKLLMQK